MSNGTVNKVILVGRMGDAADLRYTKDGKPVANFSIATNRNWKNADGEKQEQTTWHRIVCWGPIAEYVSKYLGKGARVYVEGHVENREWTDKEKDIQRYSNEVVASEVNSLETRKATTLNSEAESASAVL